VYDRVPGLTDFEPIATSEAAETFRAIDVETGDTVLVKVLSNEVNTEQFDRFTAVCRAVRSIDRHPNVASLYDAGTTSDGHPYLVVEYRSRSLADLVADSGRLRWQEVVALGAEVASALEAAHRMNVVHGEVSPSNILLDNDDVPRITDFGVRALQTAPDTSGALPGRSSISRLAHTAPEVVQGRPADERSDVYSLASTLFEALAGAPPFVRPTDQSVVPVVSRLLGEGPPSLSSIGVPGPIEAAIVGAMAKDPAQRPSSAELFRQELLAAARTAAGPEVLAAAAAAGASAVGARDENLGRRSDRTRTTEGSRSRPLIGRWRGIDLIIGAVVLVAVIGIIVVAVRSGKKDSTASGTPVTETLATDASSTSAAPTTAVPTTAAPTTAATTTPAASATGPTGTDPSTSDPTTSDPAGGVTDSTTTLAPGSGTIALSGTGFHLTSFTSNVGTTFTFPAGRDFHVFDYGVTYTGGKQTLACPGHTGLKRVEGPGLSNLKLGGCFRPGRDSAQIRIRAYSPGKVTFTLYLCDVDVFVGYCNGPTRSTNGVDITVIAT
jgi:hypothetical protein